MSAYFLISRHTNIIENNLEISDADVESFNNDDYFVIPQVEDQFNLIGNQYFGGDYNIFQPKDAPLDSWTKNSDGVWNEVLNKPENTFWSDVSNDWLTLEDYLQEQNTPQ